MFLWLDPTAVSSIANNSWWHPRFSLLKVDFLCIVSTQCQRGIHFHVMNIKLKNLSFYIGPTPTSKPTAETVSCYTSWPFITVTAIAVCLAISLIIVIMIAMKRQQILNKIHSESGENGRCAVCQQSLSARSSCSSNTELISPNKDTFTQTLTFPRRKSQESIGYESLGGPIGKKGGWKSSASQNVLREEPEQTKANGNLSSKTFTSPHEDVKNNKREVPAGYDGSTNTPEKTCSIAKEGLPAGGDGELAGKEEEFFKVKVQCWMGDTPLKSQVSRSSAGRSLSLGRDRTSSIGSRTSTSTNYASPTEMAVGRLHPLPTPTSEDGVSLSPSCLENSIIFFDQTVSTACWLAFC